MNNFLIIAPYKCGSTATSMELPREREISVKEKTAIFSSFYYYYFFRMDELKWFELSRKSAISMPSDNALWTSGREFLWMRSFISLELCRTFASPGHTHPNDVTCAIWLRAFKFTNQRKTKKNEQIWFANECFGALMINGRKISNSEVFDKLLNYGNSTIFENAAVSRA